MIKIGTSGFSFKDWHGPVYPEDLPSKDTLHYYQQNLGFNCVEINSTYYALLSDKSFAGMERKTSPDFEFVVKAYRGITHDPFDKRLANKKPTIEKAKENIDKFVYSIQPIIEANKLGSVLLQFPVFFYPNKQSTEYLIECKEKFLDIPLQPGITPKTNKQTPDDLREIVENYDEIMARLENSEYRNKLDGMFKAYARNA